MSSSSSVAGSTRQSLSKRSCPPAVRMMCNVRSRVGLLGHIICSNWKKRKIFTKRSPLRDNGVDNLFPMVKALIALSEQKAAVDDQQNILATVYASETREAARGRHDTNRTSKAFSSDRQPKSTKKHGATFLRWWKPWSARVVMVLKNKYILYKST